jgi:hypothetical protein
MQAINGQRATPILADVPIKGGMPWATKKASAAMPMPVKMENRQVWLARQMTEAFPWDTAPRYLLRDRDASYGQTFRDRVHARGRHCSAITLAESLRRARHWLDPS